MSGHPDKLRSASQGAASARTAPLARSDDLPRLSRWIPQLRALGQHLGDLQSIRLVIDTTVVIGVLSFHVRRKKKPEALTDLEETIAAGTVLAFAPEQMVHEVEKHLPELATDWDVPVERLHAAWLSIRSRVQFVPSKHLENIDDSRHARLALRDPNDLSFAVARELVGALAVVTKDKDYAGAGSPSAPVEILVDLRAYARSKAVELQIKVGGLMVTSLATGVLVGTGKGVAALARLIGRAPTAIQVGLGIAALVAIIHPKSRAFLWEKLKAVGTGVAEAWEVLEPRVAELAIEAQQAAEQAAQAHERAQLRIATTPRRATLAQTVYGALVIAERPLTVAELATLAVAHGYRPRGAGFEQYLRKVLRADARLLHDGSGRWRLRPAARASAS